MTTMIQPIYVLENGEKVSYVPIEIKNHREAYAATLHVLFKHVADFHTCIVQTFSKKYGIPEDEIMQTIQESEEFKNMRVDPVLHHDGLGYISPEPQLQEPAPQLQEPAAKKRIVKKKSPDTDIQATTVQATTVQATTVQAIQETVSSGKKVIRKKVPPATVTATEPETTPPSSAPATALTATEPKPTPEPKPTTEPKSRAPANPSTETTVEKKKVIRKKVTPPPELDRNDMPNEMQKPMQNPNVNPPHTLVDIVQLVAMDAPISQKKIIRKKK